MKIKRIKVIQIAGLLMQIDEFTRLTPATHQDAWEHRMDHIHVQVGKIADLLTPTHPKKSADSGKQPESDVDYLEKLVEDLWLDWLLAEERSGDIVQDLQFYQTMQAVASKLAKQGIVPPENNPLS